MAHRVCHGIDDVEFLHVVGGLTSFIWCFVHCILDAMCPSCFTAFFFVCAQCLLLHCIPSSVLHNLYIDVHGYLCRLAVSSGFLSYKAWRCSPVCFLFEWHLLCFTKFRFRLHIQVVTRLPNGPGRLASFGAPNDGPVRGMHFGGLVRPGTESEYLGPYIDDCSFRIRF